MNEHDFKPGDLAWIDCEDNPGVHMCRESLIGPRWSRLTLTTGGVQCAHWATSALCQSAQWVVAVNPADEDQMQRLANAYLKANNLTTEGDLREAIESLRTPPPPSLPPEPPVGSWVLDTYDDPWRRDERGWVVGNIVRSWAELVEHYAPVRLMTLGEPIGQGGR